MPIHRVHKKAQVYTDTLQIQKSQCQQTTVVPSKQGHTLLWALTVIFQKDDVLCKDENRNQKSKHTR